MVHVPEPLYSRLLEVREVLMFSFDLELLAEPVDAKEYATPAPWLPAFTVPGADAIVFGRDAMGGIYVASEYATPARTRCFHLDTSGHVVVLGDGLEEAVTLVIAVPYWRELVARCQSGNVDAMRAAAAELEREVFDDLPALPEARDYLQSLLALPPPSSEPIARLHELNQGVNAITVLSPHGWRYESPLAPAPREAPPPPAYAWGQS